MGKRNKTIQKLVLIQLTHNNKQKGALINQSIDKKDMKREIQRVQNISRQEFSPFLKN